MERHEQKGCPLRGDHEKFGITETEREGLIPEKKPCQDDMAMGSEFLGHFIPGI